MSDQKTRPEFAEIADGWALIDDFDDLTDRIERIGKFADANGGELWPYERDTVALMIKTQIAKGIKRGDFADLGITDPEILR